MDKQEINKQLAKAKIGLMAKPETVFWSTVCMGLDHHFDESIPTACTNGKYVKYNPKFFMEECKSRDERIGLVFHETGHVIFDHVRRRGDRDPYLYNIAGDHVINITGSKSGFVFPDGAVMDMKYDGWSTEQIYDDLLEDPPDPSQANIMMDVVDASTDSANDADEAPGGSQGSSEIDNDIDDLLVRAVMAAHAADQAGSVPADIQRYVDNLINPRIPWDSVLRRYMTSFEKRKFNYKLVNRRYFPGVIMPKRKNKALGNIAWGIDASASVTDEEFSTYIAGAQAVMKKYNPEEMTVIQFTTHITKIDVVNTLHELKNIEFYGRGGTNVTQVLDWAKVNKPMVLIIFSDGEFSTPNINPMVPVVWLIHNNKNFTAPYGKVIHFDI